jgi:hypothetical protein
MCRLPSHTTRQPKGPGVVKKSSNHSAVREQGDGNRQRTNKRGKKIQCTTTCAAGPGDGYNIHSVEVTSNN